jgi:hypothetical protein
MLLSKPASMPTPESMVVPASSVGVPLSNAPPASVLQVSHGPVQLTTCSLRLARKQAQMVKALAAAVAAIRVDVKPTENVFDATPSRARHVERSALRASRLAHGLMMMRPRERVASATVHVGPRWAYTVRRTSMQK